MSIRSYCTCVCTACEGEGRTSFVAFVEFTDGPTVSCHICADCHDPDEPNSYIPFSPDSPATHHAPPCPFAQPTRGPRRKMLRSVRHGRWVVFWQRPDDRARSPYIWNVQRFDSLSRARRFLRSMAAHGYPVHLRRYSRRYR